MTDTPVENHTSSTESAPFHNLGPDVVLDAVESLGYLSDLRVFPLNSYENRVYQIGLEDTEPVIAKFYRPNRWSDEQIREEHVFCLRLAELEIPVIPPIVNAENETLFTFGDHRFSLYPRRGGHAPDLDNLDTLYTLGQHLGRVHALGQVMPFNARPEFSLQAFAIDSREYLLQNHFIPDSLVEAYDTLSGHLIEKLTGIFDSVTYDKISLHGDCHPGNIIQRQDSLYLVDLDDARTGPAVQDLWMMLSGERPQQSIQLEAILDGYQEFCDFNIRELKLVESLRTLRLMHYAAWLARRWSDPAFPMAFPWFNTERYWAEHILELREQLGALDEPPPKPAGMI